MKITIFTHVIHHFQDNKYFAYGPYVHEMNLWLKYVDEVEVVAPVPLPIAIETEVEPKIGKLYKHSNLHFTGVPNFNLLSSGASIRAVFKIPVIFFKILCAMQRADHIHLRCPGNMGLIACVAQMFFPGKPKTAKYAGNWDPEAKQPWSYKLQKWLLSNTFLTRNMTVLVYGNWPNQSKNILSFFTASFFENEIEILNKEFSTPYKFLFVGNLVAGKQPALAIQIVEALNKRNIPVELHVYGDGELMDTLQNQSKNKSYIHLHGNQPLEVLKQAYKDSRFLILASKSEGWPKAVAEGMWFGCIPIATAVSCVPWMLGDGSRGVLISDGNVGEENLVNSGKRTEDSLDGLNGVNNQDVLGDTAERILELIQDPDEMRRMSMEAQEWSQEYTLERFEEAIKKLLVPKDVRP